MRTIQSELERKKLVIPKKAEPISKKQSKEKFSQQELEDLMGMRMPTFRRSKGGAMRSK
ncbi:MAG: hypothetical protein ABS944_16265 [Solibacillus sp.]|uniref:hypothetical protein n=1 Tax=Solibacillus sp. TaxID=1909654 RepID=UPI0033151929